VVATKTKTARSFCIKILKIPTKKAPAPAVPATSIGIARRELLKNVSPPRCPEATSK